MAGILRMFAPELIIQNETGLRGKYNSKNEYLDIVFRSPYISYNNMVISDIYTEHKV